MATFYALLVPKLRCIRYAGSHFLLDTYNRPLLMTSETADTIAHITLFHQGWTTPTHCCMAHQPVNPSNLDWLHRTHWRMVCQTPRYAGILPGCVSSSYDYQFVKGWLTGWIQDAMAPRLIPFNRGDQTSDWQIAFRSPDCNDLRHVRPSVCPSVTRWYRLKTNKRMIMRFSSSVRPGI